MSEATSSAPAWRRLLGRWQWVVFPLGLWVVTRLSYLLLGYFSLKLTPGLRGSSSQPLRPYPSLDALCCWDCGWYDHLAKVGFQHVSDANFWPGLPFAARYLSKLIGVSTGLAVVMVANLACLGAYITIYRLFVRLDGQRVARAGLVLFAAYPFAYYHASGYPETIMIFSSALAVSLAMAGRHVWAGIVLGLGIMSRHLTVFLGAGMLAAQLRQRGPRRFFASPSFLALGLPFLIVGMYLVWCHVHLGDALAFWRGRYSWGQVAWWNIIDVIHHAKSRPHIVSFIPFALIPTIGAVGLLSSRKYAELAAAVLPLVAVLWVIGAFALGRYSASCWPAFLPLGKWFERHPRWQVPMLLFFGLAQGWYFFLHTHHYEIQ
jgi:hypothetical protein